MVVRVVKEGGEIIPHRCRFHMLTLDSFHQAYLTYLKSYMKKLKTHLESKASSGDAAATARLANFESSAQGFAKKIVANFKDYEFFTGESMDPDGMVVLMNYREDGVTPYMIYWKDGLREVSVA